MSVVVDVVLGGHLTQQFLQFTLCKYWSVECEAVSAVTCIGRSRVLNSYKTIKLMTVDCRQNSSRAVDMYY